MRIAGILIAALVSLCTLSGCNGEARPQETDARPPLRVAISVAPLHSLVAPMLPAGSTVEVILANQGSPHADELTPSAAAAAYSADVLIYIGSGADPSVERIARRRTASGRPSISIAVSSDASSAHDGHDHDHSTEHAWLDPHMMEHALPRIRDAILHATDDRGLLTEMQRTRTNRAAEDIERMIRNVDEAFRVMLGALPPTRFVSLHGAFDALLAEYGLEHVSTLLAAHGAEPTAVQLAAASKALAADDIILVVEANENLDSIRRLIEDSGARVAILNPLQPEDWNQMMRNNLQAILKARTIAR